MHHNEFFRGSNTGKLIKGAIEGAEIVLSGTTDGEARLANLFLECAALLFCRDSGSATYLVALQICNTFFILPVGYCYMPQRSISLRNIRGSALKRC